ncbi:MAG: hypothetical protein U1E39_13275 [Planctomycetota bacterium]
MRTLAIALTVLLRLSPSSAGEAPDPVMSAFSYFEDARPEMQQPAINLLIEKGDAARLAQARQAHRDDHSADSRERVAYDGVAYCLDVARRYAASEAGSVSRWMILDELMRSGWRAHVGAVLRRAGLTALDAARVLSERAQAELAYQECSGAALGDQKAQDLAVASAARWGNAIVPHALGVLAIPPWIAVAGWPAGSIVMQQRLAVRVLTALNARVAIPYLLVHVLGPSAMLQFDVLHALAQLTGDTAWDGRDLSNLSELATQRLAWWKREGKAHAEGARWCALAGLSVAADFAASASLNSTPSPANLDGSPDPVMHFFGCLEWLTGYPEPVHKGVVGADAFVRSLQISDAIRHFQGLD